MNCFICKFANPSIYLTNKYNLPIKLMSKSSCSSLNCIYVLTCKKCHLQYVGETDNFYKRFSNHISSIKCFKRSVREPTKVASHFNAICNLNDSKFLFFKFSLQILFNIVYDKKMI